MAIPKIIHYCWLSDEPVPGNLQRYMSTWKQNLPDYEFIKWDFSRFDINSSVWVKEAFENKKYAFAADFIRMHALYTMGGIYLDMDVEVLKPFDDLLNLDYFVCYENGKFAIPEVAAFGAAKGCYWVGLVKNYYEGRHFVKSDGSYDTQTLPRISKKVMNNNGIILRNVISPSEMGGGKNELNILPYDYFSPKSYSTGKLHVTDNSYSIHHFSGSWIPWEQRLEHKLWQLCGLRPHRFMWHFDQWFSKLTGIKR